MIETGHIQKWFCVEGLTNQLGEGVNHETKNVNQSYGINVNSN